MGFVTEQEVARTQAEQGKLVVLWGQKVGIQGADVVSLDPVTREVFLADTKLRTRPGATQFSPTFHVFPESGNPNWLPQRTAITNQALVAMQRAPISHALKNEAIQQIQAGNFSVMTVGAGGLNTTWAIRLCGFQPC